ncbi:MAG TPA: XDD4 family exosortase-dependent surface protein [Lacipirellula sp.]
MNKRCQVVPAAIARSLVLIAALSHAAQGELFLFEFTDDVGDPITGSASFVVSGADLFVTLTNTSSVLTKNPNVITGILFSSSASELVLQAAEVMPGSRIWTSKTASTIVGGTPVDWSQNWTDDFGDHPPPAGYFGAGATGFEEMFHNPPKSATDFGIISSVTFPQTTSSPGNPNQFPYADNSLRLTFQAPDAGDLTGSTFSNARLLFGTDGRQIPGEIVPELGNTSMGLVAVAIGIVTASSLKRLRPRLGRLR